MGCGTPYWTAQQREGYPDERLGEKEQPERASFANEQAKQAWGEGLNARQIMAEAKGQYPEPAVGDLTPEEQDPPARPSVYTDGSVTQGGHGYWSLAGAAAWWPGRAANPNGHDATKAQWATTQDGLAIWAKPEGHTQTPRTHA